MRPPRIADPTGCAASLLASELRSPHELQRLLPPLPWHHDGSGRRWSPRPLGEPAARIHRKSHDVPSRDYSDYEKEADSIRSENEPLIDGFKAWLAESGLKETTTT